MTLSDGLLTRRQYLAGVTAGAVALAGCSAETGGAENVPVKGDPEASVTLEVYEDFACPACAAYNQQLLPQLEDEYLDSGQIRYEHRDFPFVAEPQSWQAASAAREVFASGDADAFWTFSLGVFEQQNRLRSGDTSLFAELADEVGVDGSAVESAGVDREYDEAAQADKQRGENLGVTGTPGFVIDGQIAGLGNPSTLGELFEALTDELDDALAEN